MKLRLILHAILAAVIAGCIIIGHECKAANSGPRKWAVVVGIDNYMKEVVPLRCAGNDAREFRKVLVDSLGFNDDNVFLLTSDQHGNRLPDKSSIIRWISCIKQNAAPRDTFIFYFSGHGLDTKRGSYLLTYEADPFSEDTLHVSSFNVRELMTYISGMKADTVLMFIDACRNDPRTGKGDRDNSLSGAFSKSLTIKGSALPQSQEHVAATFLSCGVGQRSYEWTEKSMGFFTYYLCKGLRGEAANREGAITLNSLAEYLNTSVTAAVKKERGKVQLPWMSRSGPSAGGEGVIGASKGIPAKAPPQAVPTPSPSLEAPPSLHSPAIDTELVKKPDVQELLEASGNLDLEGVKNLAAHLDRGTAVAALSLFDGAGNTALHNAALYNRKDLVAYYLSLGISIDNKNNDGMTPLQLTIDPDLMDMASYLISKGAKVNERDPSGHTLLHWAVISGRKDMVELFIAKGANINARDNEALTPLGYSSGFPEIIQILKKHGAKE